MTPDPISGLGVLSRNLRDNGLGAVRNISNIDKNKMARAYMVAGDVRLSVSWIPSVCFD